LPRRAEEGGAVFENLNAWEVGGLLLLALLIFGDKLPNVIADGLRMLRNLRRMAANATADLNRELGTDLKVEDLHPKAFIRKHLLSEEEEQDLRRPLQSLYDDVRADLGGVKSQLDDVATAAHPDHRPAPDPAPAAPESPRRPHRFDDDAT
jgi:sec-independent protein translocase protein TatB